MIFLDVLCYYLPVPSTLLLSMNKKDGAVPSTSLNTPQPCLKTVYSDELPLLGSEEALIKQFS